ncbi:hypothetical protein OZX57_02215 [Bifidobacterium sp. ESL0682]|uniref:hypothetical protein n=1 Tax=Bifidobacterium sp. ESL0682 TaxID=2983212 RepID=UPI0023FA4084|nr:hypothetical protein [Bifidobacterium sp. ESL0682]WEV42310.1 hypothetical protein OZX57_02215 [Bifidobacterium sp. ESL0682]
MEEQLLESLESGVGVSRYGVEPNETVLRNLLLKLCNDFDVSYKNSWDHGREPQYPQRPRFPDTDSILNNEIRNELFDGNESETEDDGAKPRKKGKRTSKKEADRFYRNRAYIRELFASYEYDENGKTIGWKTGKDQDKKLKKAGKKLLLDMGKKPPSKSYPLDLMYCNVYEYDPTKNLQQDSMRTAIKASNCSWRHMNCSYSRNRQGMSWGSLCGSFAMSSESL